MQINDIKIARLHNFITKAVTGKEEQQQRCCYFSSELGRKLYS